jgi:hypothetical protein
METLARMEASTNQILAEELGDLQALVGEIEEKRRVYSSGSAGEEVRGAGEGPSGSGMA